MAESTIAEQGKGLPISASKVPPLDGSSNVGTVSRPDAADKVDSAVIGSSSAPSAGGADRRTCGPPSGCGVEDEWAMEGGEEPTIRGSEGRTRRPPAATDWIAICRERNRDGETMIRRIGGSGGDSGSRTTNRRLDRR
ncbi:hypothetical protein HPP92_002253 [Vanilla planifolia]|uniref:Uncharacterized protein n=1 Tax=Vanilla planifolia TaxID=51239 RepID=A0A835VML8_VANPL|nr:hypothetical protein HPP92_002253 [Vanilla planifolia]